MLVYPLWSFFTRVTIFQIKLVVGVIYSSSRFELAICEQTRLSLPYDPLSVRVTRHTPLRAHFGVGASGFPVNQIVDIYELLGHPQ